MSRPVPAFHALFSSETAPNCRNAKEIEASFCGVSLLDELLSEALPFVSISLIPGPTDAVSSLVPQQPLHPSLLPRSARFSSLERATNPFHALIQNRDVLGTAGQNIQDILRQIAPPLSVLDVMALTLQWGVLFPTTPNTCPGFPLTTHDPFIVRTVPDVAAVVRELGNGGGCGFGDAEQLRDGV
ncbi:uncharacterized protein [Blastocystis hominis]|uniref:DNA polymerase alpha/delta/epsilon subunit B domain-containing protein n=1 Tax=Blastocystis hominis TaxID=12968 RepID=D8M2Y9_BLAHO|nr:uncharacterized protein [Blastocystis hominis]CBK22712.2 unnamed protein product [Blastocystis hominis]|eukprot:XP_012896760.1 uncharacterized protein [Blastocystis hominis]